MKKNSFVSVKRAQLPLQGRIGAHPNDIENSIATGWAAHSHTLHRENKMINDDPSVKKWNTSRTTSEQRKKSVQKLIIIISL